MAAIIWTDVVSLAPELSTTSATTQTDVLNWVNQVLNIAKFDGESGVTTRLARIFLAAHIAKLARLGSAGPLIGTSAGGLARSYAAPLSKSWLALTQYGQGYLALLPPVLRGPQVL